MGSGLCPQSGIRKCWPNFLEAGRLKNAIDSFHWLLARTMHNRAGTSFPTIHGPTAPPLPPIKCVKVLRELYPGWQYLGLNAMSVSYCGKVRRTAMQFRLSLMGDGPIASHSSTKPNVHPTGSPQLDLPLLP